MKIVALLAVHNEARIIQSSLEHLEREGINFFIIDDRSTDATMNIVATFKDRGLVGTAAMSPTSDVFNLADILRMKTELAISLSADWFMHADADEFRTSNQPGETLAQAILRIDQTGFNAINFQEYTFIPTIEFPDHQPGTFLETMRWYYPFLPEPLHRLNAWKNTGQEIDLVTDAGHRVFFDHRRIYHQSLQLRHYLYINKAHFISKYRHRMHPGEELKRQWHGWREKAADDLFYCAPQSKLRLYDPAKPWELDASNPYRRHLLEEH